MRVATVLSLLASQIVYQLFHPTYLVPAEESGLWEILIRQAEANPNQERACRSILLKMLQDDQPLAAREREQKVHNEVWNVLAGLVAHDIRVADDLKKCVQAGYEFWNDTKAKHDLYFFSFQPCYEEDQEQAMKFGGYDAAKGQNGSSTQRQLTENGVVLRVFPHLYIVGKQVMPGLVLREQQVEAAKSENADRATKGLRHMSISRKQPILLGRG
jgi:hypothetical protein